MSRDRRTGLLARFWAMLRETFGDQPGTPAEAARPAEVLIAAAAQQIHAAGPRPVSALPPIAAHAIGVPTAQAAPAAVKSRNLAGRIRVQARLNIPAHRSRAAMARAHARVAEKAAAKKKIVARLVWLETRKAPVAAGKPHLRLVADNTHRPATKPARPSKAA